MSVESNCPVSVDTKQKWQMTGDGRAVAGFTWRHKDRKTATANEFMKLLGISDRERCGYIHGTLKVYDKAV